MNKLLGEGKQYRIIYEIIFGSVNSEDNFGIEDLSLL